MKSDSARLIVCSLTIQCPLCDEKFRTKLNFRYHLQRNHTEVEAEDYINEIEETKSYRM